MSSGDVLQIYRQWKKEGVLSRVGAVFNQASGGASMLAAMAVPQERLLQVASIVSAMPGVNHNYEREHDFNLWFVVTASDATALEQTVLRIEQQTGIAVMRLPMVKPYRIDLAFDLRQSMASHTADASQPSADLLIDPADHPLAALAEEGLAITDQPFDLWAQQLNRPLEEIFATLQRWLASGAMRRFGNVVRHHELGFTANAMTVFNVPNDRVDALGAALARQPQVTLAYQRVRTPQWPYNLYCMIHGRDRTEVESAIARAIADCGLTKYPQAVLFSRQRFKQTGGSRFRAQPSLQSPSKLSEEDLRLIERLHGDFPLTETPFADIAREFGVTEQQVLNRLQQFLDQGVLTRFGPLFQIERAGGQFVLAAIAVPQDRFKEVTDQVNGFSEVAHNYRRDHELNMWFVVAAESPVQAQAVITKIENTIGLPVLAFPKEREFFVELRLPLMQDKEIHHAAH